MEFTQMLRPKEAGQVLKIGLTSVYKLVKEKKLRAYYLNSKGKRMMRIRRKDLETYIAGLMAVGDTVKDTVTGSNNNDSSATPAHKGEIAKSLTA